MKQIRNFNSEVKIYKKHMLESFGIELAKWFECWNWILCIAGYTGI